MEFFAVDEVEHLHHDKSVEDESKVSREYSELTVNLFIVAVSAHCFESPAPDCSTDDAVFPFELRMASEDCLVVRVNWLRNEVFSEKDENHDDHELENRLANDVLEHSFRDDVLISRVRRPMQHLFRWWFCGECQWTQSVHDQVDPKHLNGF